MYVRRLLLLALAALAITAFAAPVAQADGPFWYVNSERVGEPAGKNNSFDIEGTLNRSFWGMTSTCGVEGSGVSSRESGKTVAYITSYTIQTPCPTNLPGCTVETATNNTEEGGEWLVKGIGTANTETIGIEIEQEFSDFCKETYGISKVPLEGTLKGKWNAESGCIEYVAAGALKTTGGMAVSTSGEECITYGGKAMSQLVKGPANVEFEFDNGVDISSCENPTASGKVWNGGSNGEGRLGQLSSDFCISNLPMCYPTFSLGNSPSLTATGPDEVSLGAVTFVILHEQECSETYGVPETITLNGTLNGVAINEANCIEFNDARFNSNPSWWGGADVSGEICLKGAGGTPLTLS